MTEPDWIPIEEGMAAYIADDPNAPERAFEVAGEIAQMKGANQMDATDRRDLAEFEEDIERSTRAVVPLPMPQQHLVVGVGALAALSEADFEHNIEQLTEGQRRVAILTDKLLIRGEDYGRVPGIAKPFLQKPGAEKLGNFYGLAVRFEAERIVGKTAGEPPLAYHVKAFAHLGSFDGPVVAQGFGEASVYEERYRWRNAEPTCPECGRQGLIKRKSPPNLAGKWNCPAWGGKEGCNRVFEPNDERIKTGGRVENTDPWSLANTLVKMAEKRAHVDVILRATGTSGFFSQDEDSPSVQAQVAASDPTDDNNPPQVEKVEGVTVERGGKVDTPTDAAIARLTTISREQDLGPAKVAEIVQRVTGTLVHFGEATDRRSQSKALLAAIKALTADQLGRVLQAVETGVIEDEEDAAAMMLPEEIHPGGR